MIAMPLRRSLRLLLATAALSAAPPALAQQQVGGEFQVNRFTPNTQFASAVAFDQEGDFVVVWSSDGQDGVGLTTGVFARRFAAGGTAQSPDLQVNTFAAGDQTSAAAGMDAKGGFVVVWASPQDGDFSGIFGRRFDAFGTPLAVEFQVNTVTLGLQNQPDVAVEGNGEFLVVWQSTHDGGGTGIFGQRFDAIGTPFGAEFQVNRYTAGDQRRPALEVETDGDFMVIWDSDGQDGSAHGVFARRFNLFASPVGTEFQLNSYTVGDQFGGKIALDGDGDGMAVWISTDQDGSGSGIFGRRFTSAGQVEGLEIQVPVVTANDQGGPNLAASAGGFVVVWEGGGGQDGSLDGIFARRFNTSGSALGGALQVNTFTTDSQSLPRVAAVAGEFAVVWSSSADQDGDGSGVFGQRFGATLSIDVDGDGATLPLTDGLLILRSAFGFTGNTLIAGAVNVTGCTRCTAPAIEAYLDTLF